MGRTLADETQLLKQLVGWSTYARSHCVDWENVLGHWSGGKPQGWRLPWLPLEYSIAPKKKGERKLSSIMLSRSHYILGENTQWYKAGSTLVLIPWTIDAKTERSWPVNMQNWWHKIGVDSLSQKTPIITAIKMNRLARRYIEDTAFKPGFETVK